MATNTAASFSTPTANGTAGPFNIGFTYLAQSEIDVTVDGVLKTLNTHYIFHSTTQISFTSGNFPSAGQAIKFQRNTDLSAKKVDFQNGSVLTEADLDSNSDQVLFGLQEFVDEINNNVIKRDGTQTITNNLVFEGSSDDANETTLGVVNPTADRTINLPNVSGTVVTTGDTGTVTTDMIGDDQVTPAKIGNADLKSLSNCQTGSAASLANLTNNEVAILDGATVSTTELNTLDGVNSTLTASELNTLDGITASTANLNQLTGKEVETSVTGNSNAKIPTSKAVNDLVLAVTNALGGFVAIANATSFPTSHPDPSDNAGTVVSITDANGIVVNSSGVATISNGAGSSTVTINGFPTDLRSRTLGSGIGLQVQTTTTLHTYDYHKALIKESDLVNFSADVDSFRSRYRVVSTTPTSDNDKGDIIYRTSDDKLLIYNGTAFQDPLIGNFHINTLSSYNGTGGNTATFNGSAYRFNINHAPEQAQQLLVSINGVIQKPNSGTSQPSEGFALNGDSIIFGAAPASGSDFFIITIGKSVNIGVVSDGTITDAKVASDASIEGTKINPNFGSQNIITSGTVDGRDVSADGAKLDGIEANAINASNTAITNKLPLAGGTLTGNLTINTTAPLITFNESDTSKIFNLVLDGSALSIRKDSNAGSNIVQRWNSDGHVDFLTNVDFASGIDVTGNITLVDNGKIILGDGGETDSFISFDGQHLQIRETSPTGALLVDGHNIFLRNPTQNDEKYLFCNGGSTGRNVELYCQGTKRLETTSTGVDVTGAITATASAANTDILTLTTHNSRTLNFTTPNGDSGSLPFVISTSNAIEFKIDNQSTLFIDDSGQVNLHHDGSSTAKLFTDATGISVNGTLNISQSGSNNTAGLKILDSNNSGAAPFIEVIGKRSDGNDSQCFSGKVHLAIHRTNAKIDNGKVLGTVAFGGNHTDDSISNILYSASISGIASNSFDAADDMPTDLVFFTGSTGRTQGQANVTTGDERMRIKSDGAVELTESLKLFNSKNLNIGTNNRLVLKYDGVSRVQSDAKPLYLKGLDGSATQAGITMYKGGGSEKMFEAFNDGAVKLYFDNGEKLATTTDGVDVTGNVVATASLRNLVPSDFWNSGSHFAVGDLGHISTHGGFEFTITSGGYRRQVSGVGKWKDVAVDGVGGFGCQIALAPKTGKIHLRSNSGLSTDDNNPSNAGLTDRLVVDQGGITVTGGIGLSGALLVGNEINMFNGTTNSHRFIDCGLGDGNNLRIRGCSGGDTAHENMIIATRGGGVNLYYDGVTTAKLETTASGAVVNGELDISGASYARTMYQISGTDTWSVGLRNSAGGDTNYHIFRETGHTGEVEINAKVNANSGLDVSGSINCNGNTVWHAGNDGSGSGLDADLFQGSDKIYFYREVASASATVGSGWITVAENTSTRKHGEIFVSDSESGDHAFIRIDWMRSYSDSTFTVLNTGGHNNRITGVRVLSEDADDVYGNKKLQIYGTVQSTYRVAIKQVQNQANWGNHTVVTPVVQDTITGYSVHGSALENLNTYPFAQEEGIQAGANGIKSLGDVIATGDGTFDDTRIGEWAGNSNFTGVLHKNQSGSEYMMISSGSSTSGHTYISATTGMSVVIRGGNNTNTNQIEVQPTGGINLTAANNVNILDGNISFENNSDDHPYIRMKGNNHRVKYGVFNSQTYGMGMKNGMSYGSIGGSSTEYAMTFQMNDSDNRGWVFLDSLQSDAQGAMSLTTQGKMTVAHSMRLGYGESDTTVSGTTHALDVSGSANITGTLEAKAIRFGDSHVKRISVDYTGEDSGDGENYLMDNEFQEILTITPGGNYRNYTIIGRIFAQDGSLTHTVDLSMTLRINARPNASVAGTYVSTIAGGYEYLTPRLWLDATSATTNHNGTTGKFKLAVEINKKIHGRVTADLEIITRNEADLDHVVVNEDETSEILSVPSGYTQTTPTKVYESDDGVISFDGALTAGGLTFPTSNGTDGQVLTSTGTGTVQWEDAAGGSTFTSGLTVSDASGSDPTLTINHSDLDTIGEFIRIGRTTGSDRYHKIVARNSATAGNNYIGLQLHDGGSNSTSTSQSMTISNSSTVLHTTLTVHGNATLNGTVQTYNIEPKLDDTYDIGTSNDRYDDIFATNTTISSSDERLKQDIQALTTAEKAVATTLKGLIKTFKYKKAVAAKGDKARIHCGVIAQEVKTAFEAQGLKAEDYALFCYDEWDAVAEEKDEDGNITQPAVAAGNRYSIRYTELLAFIISVL